MKKNTSNSALFIIGIALLVVLGNLVSLQGFFRIDLTKDKKFTLSQASVDTVSKLADTMTVSAYFTEGLPPPYGQHARYVKDLLEEYASSADANFAYEFLDPASSETEEDRELRREVKRDIFGRLVREPTSVEKELSELGLQPVEIRMIEDDQQQTKRAYMGIVIRYQEKHEVIPVVQNLSDLEKDMTSLMRKLTRTREPRLGLIKDDVQGPHIQRITQALRQNMSVESVILTAEDGIAEDLDALLIVGSGEHFGDKGAEQIDAFLRKGKSGAFLIDRYRIDPQTFQHQAIGPRSKTHEIFDLVKSYGMEITSSLVADASCASLNVQESRGGFNFSLPIKYPFVPELLNLSFESPITKGLSGVILPFVAKLNVDNKEGLDVKVLAQSSKVSWLEEEPLDLNPRRDWGESNIQPSGPYDLLAQGRGVLPNSEGDNAQAQTTEEQKPKDTRLVVMGTSSFLWDEFLSPSNQTLALNMVDWMLADSALLEMRAREFSDTPLDADLSDGVRQGVKYGNILGVPFLLVLYGLIRWRVREARRRSLRIKG